MSEDLQAILDAQPAVALAGEGGRRGKVDYDMVLDEFMGKWTTYAEIHKYITDDLGTEVTYSAPHSWVGRLAKGSKYDVVATEYDGDKYIKITKSEGEE